MIAHGLINYKIVPFIGQHFSNLLKWNEYVVFLFNSVWLLIYHSLKI